jgi:diadenylate cyclase
LLSSIKTIFANFRFADLLDIAVVSFFIYFALTWIRRRASRSLVIGIGLVVALYALAGMLNMYMTSQVFQAGLTAALVALVLIFQEDIRMAVERIATWGNFHSKHNLIASNRTVDALVEAFTNLAHDKIGALVVFKGRESFERHLSGGIPINGRISVPLLYSIFHPETPSHDGAAIIEGERIEKFGVRLPLSHNLAEVGEAGTRHTAGLGLAERSDALVVIVSEERGVISIAEDGRLERVEKEQLRMRLDGFYRRMFPKPSEISRKVWFTQNSGEKIISIGIATIMWFLFAFRVETVDRTFSVPIEYRNIPSNWVVEDPRPSELKISLSGLERSFHFDPSSLVASVDASKLREGYQTISISEHEINFPQGLDVKHLSPRTLSVHAFKIDQIDLPVKVRTTGSPQGKYSIEEIRPFPPAVKVSIPHSQLGSIEEIYTEPLNLSKADPNSSIKLQLQVPPEIQLLDENQKTIRVTFILTDRSKDVKGK